MNTVWVHHVMDDVLTEFNLSSSQEFAGRTAVELGVPHAWFVSGSCVVREWFVRFIAS